MDNPIWGIVTIAFSAFFFLLSYHYQRRDHYTIAIALMMLGGLTLRVFTACDFFLHPWDEVYHAVVAKHMIHHPFIPTLYENPVLPYDYKNWSGNHIWVHKQPLPLWTMAASMSVFGVNEIALRLPSILLTTVGVFLTFYIGSYIFDKRTGYLAAFFYAINGLIIEMTAGRVATDHVDVFFLFFTELAIFFSVLFVQKKYWLYNVLVGISIGAAILCKWLPALIVLPIWLLLVLDSGAFDEKAIIAHFIVVVSIATLIFIPWQVYIYRVFPMEAATEAGHNMKHITEVLDNQGGPIYYYLNKIRINYGELVYLPLLWLCWQIFRTRLSLKKWSLITWMVVPILFFSLLMTKMQGYILFTSPAVFMASAAFVIQITIYAHEENRTQRSRWAIAIIGLLFIILPIRYSVERIKPFAQKKSPRWIGELKELDRNSQEKSVIFNFPRPIDAMFYTDMTVYSSVPDIAILEDLQQKGYHILINDNDFIPENIRSLKEITFFKTTDATN